MPNRTLSQVVEGQTLISAIADTSVRAAAIAMANSKVGAIMVVGGNDANGDAAATTGPTPPIHRTHYTN